MGQTCVSILMPVYNAEPFLEKALESVLKQSFQDWELIAVNDGSIDQSIHILKRYQSMDSRILVFDLPEGSVGGEGIPVNYALAKASGTFVMRLDSDDCLTEDALEVMSRTLKDTKADIAIAKYRLIDSNGEFTVQDGDERNFNWLLSTCSSNTMFTPFYDLLLHLGPVAWRSAYRRDFLTKNNICYPDTACRSQDHGFFWLCYVHAKKVFFVDRYINLYRVGHEYQLTNVHLDVLIESYGMVMDWVVMQLYQRNLLSYYRQIIALDNVRQLVGMAAHQSWGEAYRTLEKLQQRLSLLQEGVESKSRIQKRLSVRYWMTLSYMLKHFPLRLVLLCVKSLLLLRKCCKFLKQRR